MRKFSKNYDLSCFCLSHHVLKFSSVLKSRNDFYVLWWKSSPWPCVRQSGAGPSDKLCSPLSDRRLERKYSCLICIEQGCLTLVFNSWIFRYTTIYIFIVWPIQSSCIIHGTTVGTLLSGKWNCSVLFHERAYQTKTVQFIYLQACLDVLDRHGILYTSSASQNRQSTGFRKISEISPLYLAWYFML
jgi:hypothetical protein